MAARLEKIVEDRYQGQLWEAELVAGRLNPKFKRTDEDFAKLNELKRNIQEFIEAAERLHI